MNNAMLPRMRTIPQAVKELKKADENTAINEHSLRKLVKSGVIPCVTTGRKVLICLDTIEEYLGRPQPMNIKPFVPPGIRKIEE